MADERMSDTETVLLDAALAEVLAHGIRRTTASDIARRGGVSRQTLVPLLARRPGPVRRPRHARADRRAALRRPTPRRWTLWSQSWSTPPTASGRFPSCTGCATPTPSSSRRYILERLGTSQRAMHAALAARIARGQEAASSATATPSGWRRWCC